LTGGKNYQKITYQLRNIERKGIILKMKQIDVRDISAINNREDK
jgi:hypothetical protein